MSTYTVKKNEGSITLNSTLSWEVDTSETPFVWYNTSNTTGSQYHTCDLSVIPPEATILNATYKHSYSASLSGAAYATIRTANNSNYGDCNSTNLKKWLVAGNRTVRVLYSYRPNKQDDVIGSGSRPTSAYAVYSNITFEVEYEANLMTWKLHYGIDGQWIEVEARGGTEGSYKAVYAYYGENNQWELCKRADVDT